LGDRASRPPGRRPPASPEPAAATISVLPSVPSIWSVVVVLPKKVWL
jgi:hypothetical protein